MTLKAQLQEAVGRAVQQLGGSAEASIQDTPEGKPGDYGTAIAFSLSKVLGEPPHRIAARLASIVKLPPGVARVEAVGPFLNFFLDGPTFIRGVVESTFQPRSRAGKIVVEHTSINPNKELHVGHLRNVVLGDSIARIFRAAGYTVEVQNYIDDTGRQTAESLFASAHYGRTWDGAKKYDHWLGECYVQLNADPAKESLEPGIRQFIHRLETGALRAEVEKVVHAHLETCFRLGARYDLLTWESDVVGSGFLDRAIGILEKSRYTSRPTQGKYAGALVMNVSDFMSGLEEPQVVLIRSDGTAMYTAKDIGLQFWKFGLFEGMTFKRFVSDPEGKVIWTSAPDGELDAQRRFGHADEVINVIDSRQANPQTIVASALGVAGEPQKQARSIHLSYTFVTLQGQTISGRKGLTVSADEAMDEAQRRAAKVLAELNPALAERDDAAETARVIGIGAIRFTMLKVDPSRKIDFRWDQALSLQGDTAPYVQYAAVRAANIVRRGIEAGYSVGGPSADWNALPPVDLLLAKQITKLPEILDQCVRIHSPHPLAQYALELATAFNGWYNSKSENGKPLTNVLQSPAGMREARLALMARFRAHVEQTLAILGIEVPAAM